MSTRVSVEPDAQWVDAEGLQEAIQELEGIQVQFQYRQVGAGPGDIIHILIANLDDATTITLVAERIAGAVQRWIMRRRKKTGICGGIVTIYGPDGEVLQILRRDQESGSE